MLRVLIYNIYNWVLGRFLFYNNIIIFNESDLLIASIHGHIGIVGSSVSITTHANHSDTTFHSCCDQLKCVPEGGGVGRATGDLWEGFLKYVPRRRGGEW